MPFNLPSAEEIEAVVSSVDSKDSHDIAKAFRNKSAEGDAADWDTLAQIFDLHFRREDATEPFGPMHVMEDGRSMIPDDLTDEQLDALRQTLDDTTDPECRARIGDVLWVRRRDAPAGRVAVEAYLASGHRLEDPEH